MKNIAPALPITRYALPLTARQVQKDLLRGRKRLQPLSSAHIAKAAKPKRELLMLRIVLQNMGKESCPCSFHYTLCPSFDARQVQKDLLRRRKRLRPLSSAQIAKAEKPKRELLMLKKVHRAKIAGGDEGWELKLNSRERSI